MNFIDYDEIDFGYPGPVRTPVPRANVQPFGRHYQNAGGAIRCWKVPTSSPIVTSKDADRNLFELASPPRDEFFCQCTQRRDINGAKARLDRMNDRLLCQPCFATAGGHLKNAAESRRQKSMVDHALLGWIQRDWRHRDKSAP
jgi:hypothetical protein